MPKFKDKVIEVCSECKTASCWYGEFMCEGAKDADTMLIIVSELRKLKTGESEDYWSDNIMQQFYGNPAPYGYRTR